MENRSIRTDLSIDHPYGYEHDSCALYLSARKNGQSTFGTLKRALWRLSNMGHRTGYVNGEGDGAGVQTDIPRRLWAKKISQAGLPASLATQPGFWVGHLIIPYGVNFSAIQDQIYGVFSNQELNLLLCQPGPIRTEALGLNAQFEPPSFWQLAGKADVENLEKRLFAAKLLLEKEHPLHFASLSSHTVTYKIRGSVETLAHYFPELQDRSYDTIMALCHARYSTNTVSNFERSQPFALIGHNGEINTINQFRHEARQIGIQLPKNGSDSQDIDRALEHFCIEQDMSLFEAMELVFPPTPYETDKLPAPLQEIYLNQNYAFGPFAQGPAAIGARFGDIAVCSLDALGLRPLWFSETEKEYIFSSERGAILLEDMVADSRPFSPGEKMGLIIQRGNGINVLNHQEIRQHVLSAHLTRQNTTNKWSQNSTRIDPGFSKSQNYTPFEKSTQQQLDDPQATVLVDSREELAFQIAESPRNVDLPWIKPKNKIPIEDSLLTAAGWNKEHVDEVIEQAATGKDPIGSMGFDGPLAALSKNPVNLSDFFKETVAVVTNPAIDRGREYEVFSTRVIIGARPEIISTGNQCGKFIVLDSPLLRGGLFPQENPENTPKSQYSLKMSIEELSSQFSEHIGWIPLAKPKNLSMAEAVETIALSAVEQVRSGINCLILDDSEAIVKKSSWIDPLLATAKIDNALTDTEDSLRRQTGIIIRSACIRNLHDIILLCSYGADAVNPYAMLAISQKLAIKMNEQLNADKYQSNLLNSLQAGIEKVISTIGSHEFRGYGRVCSSIGLSPEIAGIFQSPNFLGSTDSGVNWETLEKDAEMRAAILKEKSEIKLPRANHFYSKLWKTINQFSQQQGEYSEISKKYRELQNQMPVALRHLMNLKKAEKGTAKGKIDISINGKDLPLVIAAMSFGSQGELAFRAYAKAAHDLNIVCINGEGGELPDIFGMYKSNRGQQVASGRFGVNTAFLNSSAVIEIKIGQGAKPGEGGMLPAEKVNEKVAKARHTPPYVPLLSPSNNHDLYSIEDLAQLIEELKTVSPDAKISVKCPCVPGIGVIAVGIAKAGADIINLSGYDGATGAARKHAIKYVGLPVEIGVTQAHRALIDAGIRGKVEIWCDGGMKTGEDIIKMILLGANRVGFGSMAMIAIGCTLCRKCYKGNCHMGITTHIKSTNEAYKKGLKHFSPRNLDKSVKCLVRLFSEIGDEVRDLTAQLGSDNLQNLVGRVDLLEQVLYKDRVDLSAMLTFSPPGPKKQREPGVGRLLTRDRNQLTRYISDSVLNAVDDGEMEVTYKDQVMAYDRALGSHLFGALTRQPDIFNSIEQLHLHFGPSSIGGNGFAAWSTDQTDILIEGGAQDGVAKGASGGRVAIMKGLNHDGLRIDGSVGKSFAYGAQKGLLIVQGNADSRACIRLSGADVILGGEITQPINGNNNHIGSSANLKGFTCEYMTSGRVIIMGDPGPYAFSGMTGGVVYQLLTPEMGFTLDTLKTRLARGANVQIYQVDSIDIDSIQELLEGYHNALLQTNQYELAEKVYGLSLSKNVQARFVKIQPHDLNITK